MPFETKEEILKLGEPDPELVEILKSSPLPPLDYSDLHRVVELAKGRIIQAKQLLGPPPLSVIQTETTYPTRDGAQLRALLYQPASPPSDGSPLILLFHGGGFCLGFPEGEEQSARNLVQAYGAVCLSISYRLAPQFPFPYAINDAWDALKWAAENAKSFKADPSLGFVVGGSSAGGNISAILAHLARDEGLTPPLTGQWLCIPTVCSQNKMPEKYHDRFFSYEQNQNAPVLSPAAIDMFMGGYKPDEDDGVYYAVLNHPKGHADLPPTFLQIDGLDPLRDEGLIYESVLREEYGIKTRLNVYPGCPHGHWAYFPTLTQSHKFREEQVEGFGWLLGRQAHVQEVETTPVATVS